MAPAFLPRAGAISIIAMRFAMRLASLHHWTRGLMDKEKAALRRLILYPSTSLLLNGVSCVPGFILNIAHGTMGRSLGLIDLAFGF
jgi:hypothetical protein